MNKRIKVVNTKIKRGLVEIMWYINKMSNKQLNNSPKDKTETPSIICKLYTYVWLTDYYIYNYTDYIQRIYKGYMDL